MAKRPSFQLYPGDWYRDGVAGCSLAAQGLWLRMMYIAHDSERYGYLSENGVPIPPERIARRVGADSLEQYTSLLGELDSAAVPSRTPDGIIYSRRMVKDERERQLCNGRKRQFKERSKNAQRTLVSEEEDEEEVISKEVLKNNKHPSIEEVVAYCKERQNFVDPAQWYDFYQSKGWKIGKSPMKDWRAAVRTWEKKAAEEVSSRPYDGWMRGN